MEKNNSCKSACPSWENLSNCGLLGESVVLNLGMSSNKQGLIPIS